MLAARHLSPEKLQAKVIDIHSHLGFSLKLYARLEFPYGPHELYDLVHDPGERRNLVEEARHGSLIRELRGRLEEWFLESVDPENDGAREAVTGHGQLGLSGRRAAGEGPFEPVRAQEF